ncbi:flagellar basal body rod protein FlgC [Terrilactibacillus sp. BCM23-1]|uniref:Flagellar basal-body rod protein FlgC n=1 Tax=Terrilactibacillus tamarindi TaxID=2599694 RepID=A0A6N8CQ75_9BACI|nr:flagellar basal body rod protein FlgC [Terrilactibacillus tamarindi]MTT32284.1 flagellar basal body rod protein FlgC [Terrilactibacillus tamarindi]
MGMFNGLNISASGLTAQRLRMDVISSNIANADTTRDKQVNGEWQPYRRKIVEMSPANSSFQSFLNQAVGSSTGSGVKVTKVTEDQTPFNMTYEPNNPDADNNGYVRTPNVDPLKEMVDLMNSQRSYEANVTVMNANKSMLTKALEIGK